MDILNDMILDVPVSQLDMDFVRIENLDQYLSPIKQINPLNEEEYLTYWASVKKKCVEGMWGEESKGFRYMPSDLYFYGNLFTIQDTDASKQTLPIRPLIRDLDWELAYGLLVAEGFSGFYGDKQFSCDEWILEYKQTGIPAPNEIPRPLLNRYYSVLKPDGRLKEYIEPIKYLRGLHKSPLGPPLYFNEARNFSVLGSRGGGKSYFIAGKATKMICTDNIKYYDEKARKAYLYADYKEEFRKPLVEIMVGSGNTSKSSEFAAKIEFAMNQLTVDQRLGVWGDLDDPNYTPCPLYKQMRGSLEPNNKKDPWRHEYDGFKDGRKITKGSGSKVYHVSYFEQKAKGKGAQEGAGGRVALSIIEESGLCFARDTEIRMFNGSTKKVQDIEVGDLVMGPDGTFRTVVDTTRGEDDMYEVSQTFGDSYTVNSEHPIVVKHKRWYKGKKIITKKLIEAKEFNNTPDKKTHYGYKNSTIEFPSKSVELDPYYYGYWLGDGIKTKADLTISDKEVLDYFTNLAKQHSLKVKKVNDNCGKAAVYSPCRDQKDQGGKLNYFRQGLKKYDSFSQKKLHLDFIHNSLDVRLQLLAGLLDSDGCLISTKTSEYFEFYQTDRLELIEAVEYLCTTLGLRVTRRTRKTNKGYDNKILDSYRTKYILRISGDVHKIPTKIERKKAKFRKYVKDFLNTSIKVKPVGRKKYYGFTLKEDSLFLLKDGTVAHNTSNSIQVHNSNTFVVTRNGIQIGVQVDIGTSGNIDAIQETRKKFLNPSDYRLVPYYDKVSETHTGFFLPYYMTLNFCKDKDGNTIWEKAFAETRKRREIAAAAKDPSVLREEKMNAPIIREEMWTSSKGYRLPYDELLIAQRRLNKGHLYHDLARPVKLIWDSTLPYGVKAIDDLNLDPYFHFPIESSRQSREGPVMIFHEPITLPGGEIPQKAYLFVYDMYVSENIDDGGSLGVTYVVLDPIYWDQYLDERGPIHAAYIGKHPNGLDGYHEVQEKLIAYYGNPEYSMFFEKERGRSCRDYYIKKKKGHLLGLTPGTYDSDSVFQKRIADYGIPVGGKIGKIKKLDMLSDWLKETVTIKNSETGATEVKMVIETLSDKFFIDQGVYYTLEEHDNYDAVSAMILLPVALKEREYYISEQAMTKNKHNPLRFLTNNKLFKNEDNPSYKRQGGYFAGFK